MLIIFNIQSHWMVRVCVKLNAYDSFAKMQCGRTIEMYSNTDVNRMQLNGMWWDETRRKTHLRTDRDVYTNKECERRGGTSKNDTSKNDTSTIIDDTNFGYRTGDVTFHVNVFVHKHTLTRTHIHIACGKWTVRERKHSHHWLSMRSHWIVLNSLKCMLALKCHFQRFLDHKLKWTRSFLLVSVAFIVFCCCIYVSAIRIQHGAFSYCNFQCVYVRCSVHHFRPIAFLCFVFATAMLYQIWYG